MQELVAYAKTHDIAYSSSGTGNANHLSGELINKLAGTKINHIPYKGVAPQLADVAAGHVAMTFASIGASLPFIRGGKARPSDTVKSAEQEAEDEAEAEGSGKKRKAASTDWRSSTLDMYACQQQRRKLEIAHEFIGGGAPAPQPPRE